jgi:hypothetical protein
MLVSIGGIKHSTARFVSDSEDRNFTLRLESKVEAQRLARFIYGALDITAEVHRDDDGIIVDGELIEFHEVASGDPLAAWRRWYEVAGSDWDDLEDIEAELGRIDEGLEHDA